MNLHRSFLFLTFLHPTILKSKTPLCYDQGAKLPYKVIGGEPVPVSYSADEVFAKIKHDQIKFIDLQFTGLRGRFHHTTISSSLFTPQQMQDGLPKLDGSSIVGFANIDDSDMVLKPDPNTFATIPWMTNSKTARLICDVYWGWDKGRLEKDPRGIAQKAEKYLKTQGFDIRYDTLTNAADGAQTYKYVVRNIAKKYDKVATMMPKPISMDAGSGMHTNVSLWKDDKNIFFDKDDKEEISQTARYYCGGIMNHARALSAIVAPTTNSYHRLVPGYEAPVYIAWSASNRSAIIRVPAHFKGEKYAKIKRLEFRAPDPSSNPYLVFAAVLAAGLDGVKKKIEPGDPVHEDIYKMTKVQRDAKGIKDLPATLGEALDELENDRQFLAPIFSNETIDTIVEIERTDDHEISIRPHPHEFYLYFDI